MLITQSPPRTACDVGLMTCFLMFYVKLGVSRKTSMPMYGANAGFGGGEAFSYSRLFGVG